VVVPKEDLMVLWRKAFLKFTDLKESDIGMIRQDVFDVANKPVVIGMLHSLAIEGRYPSWIKREFGLVVFDEVHRLGAETFSRVVRMFAARRRVGLSATPYRADGKEAVFTANIGPVQVQSKQLVLKPKIIVVQSNWVCPRGRNGKRVAHVAGRTMHLTKSISHDTERNRTLCGVIVAAYNKGRRVVVFSDLIEHLKNMLRLSASAIPRDDMALYIGGMSEKARDVASGKKVLFATYKMMSEGTDIPWLDTCILTTPRADVKQVIGRILREYPDKKEPVIIDVNDGDSQVFGAYHRKRMAMYRNIGASFS